MIVAYVSGHGFGHATRTAEVLRELKQRRPEIALTVVTSAPRFLFEEAVSESIDVRSLACDVGLAQNDAVDINEQATLSRLESFQRQWESLVENEARRLRMGVRGVIGDIPPLAFAAAARAGIPSVAMANFSWDWIYRHLSQRLSGMSVMAVRAADAYRQATLLLRLPFAGDLSVFPHIADIPLVARRPFHDAAEVRRRLGHGAEPLVLMSFGGHGLARLDPQVLASLKGYRFLFVDDDRALPENAIGLSRTEMRLRGLKYIDLVAAADVVVTKPGYGIVTDAISGGTRIVYTERGDFPEYAILVREMREFLPCAFVRNDDLEAGRLDKAIRTALERPFPSPPRLDGAAEAARLVMATFRLS
ncbi:MAG: hypothetical protein JXO72_14125 [Vicinamibacteria bacterium]|nr:hypothetical protein [Vicinamibacteria bacterium]